MEIPSGYLADVIGRKKTLLLGSLLATSGFIFYTIFNSFEGFLIAEIIMGIGASFISGSDSALLYDSLMVEKRENEYLKHEGIITSLGNFSETIASLIGGSIAILVGFKITYGIQVSIAFLAIPASLLLKEPPRLKKINKLRIKDIVIISRDTIFKNKNLSRSIILSSVIGTCTLSMAWIVQVFFTVNNFNEKQSTFFWTTLNLTVAIFAILTPYIKKTLQNKKTIITIAISLITGLVSLSLFEWQLAIGILFIFYAARGFATPILKDNINAFCESNVRATVLSIRSLIIRLSFSIIAPIIGYLTNSFTFKQAMIFTSFTFGTAIIIASFRFLRIEKEKILLKDTEE